MLRGVTTSQFDKSSRLLITYRRDKWLLAGLLAVTVIVGAGIIDYFDQRVKYLQNLLEKASPSNAYLGFWTTFPYGSIAENLLCGLFLALCIAGFLKAFHFDDAFPSDPEAQLMITSGIARLLPEWQSYPPDQKALCDLFKKSKVVDIYGITFYSKLFEAEDFEDLLKSRLDEKNKKTRILLLEPNGEEITRRHRRNPERQLSEHALLTHQKLARVAAQHTGAKFYHTFDYPPGFGMLRFDNVAFINLQLMRDPGDPVKKVASSPGVEIRRGWLFPHYKAEFDFVWHERSAGEEADTNQ